MACDQNVRKKVQINRLIYSAIIVLETFGITLLRFPTIYSFNAFALWDWGGYLVAYHLFELGKKPLLDFGWQYGLLPLLIETKWFELFGATPASFLALSVLTVVPFVVVLAILAQAVSQRGGRVLLVLALPFIFPIELDLPHTLEALLLSLALLSQGRSKLGMALAFTTAGCFTKPSMSYFYGLILLIFLCWDLRNAASRRIHRFVWELAPALVVFCVLSVTLIAFFGGAIVVDSLLPLDGARAYKALGFGWNRIIWGLFYFPGVKFGYYIGTPAVFWAVSSIYIIATIVLSIFWSGTRRTIERPAYSLVVACALLQIFFVSCCFGSAASWNYYAYVPVVGALATERWSAACRKAIVALCVMAALANYGWVKTSFRNWRLMRPSKVTDGLYVSNAERTEWSEVASLGRNKEPVLFSPCGAGSLLFPWFRKPVAAFIEPGVSPKVQVENELSQLRAAQMIVIPTAPEYGNEFAGWPQSQFGAALDGTTTIFKGRYFLVYRHPVRPVSADR